jgi:hypothetical protein
LSLILHCQAKNYRLKAVALLVGYKPTQAQKILSTKS